MWIDWGSEARRADWPRRAHYAIVFIAVLNAMNKEPFRSVNTRMNGTTHSLAHTKCVLSKDTLSQSRNIYDFTNWLLVFIRQKLKMLMRASSSLIPFHIFPLIYICARTRVHLLLEKVSFRSPGTIDFNSFFSINYSFRCVIILFLFVRSFVMSYSSSPHRHWTQNVFWIISQPFVALVTVRATDDKMFS